MPKPNGDVKITKAKMQAYEDVRQSGVTNMFDVATVMKISGLTRPECMEIMKSYAHYMELYGIERS